MSNTIKKLEYIEGSNQASEQMNEMKSKLDALNRVQALIEFNLDGTVITANDNFLGCLGYSLDEIEGKHHKMFCEASFVSSLAYRRFWEKLAKGEFESGEFKRIGKGGKEIWINASYNPVFDASGKVYKVIKFATDITAAKNKNVEFEAKQGAISKVQAIIEFGLDGTVITANENFLKALGYSLAEIEGKHHQMFCDPAYTSSPAYKVFWDKLNRGEFDSGEYKRIGKGGKEIWINASYNPVLDVNGKVAKVVKFATDITETKRAAMESDGKMVAISKAQAIIEFNLDGTVITANDNFLKTLGYDLSEIKGKHHRMFCDSEYTAGNSYRAFWEKLNRGEFDSGEYKRIGKGGKIAWINASYNPILDPSGKPYKVVKFATDVTAVKNMILSVEETATALSSASAELTATATEMENTSNRTSDMAVQVSAASQQVSSGVQTVATNMEEMVASIKEIARSTNDSSQMAKTTLKRANDTNVTITQLGVSSQEIGDVIKVISSIAQQTNLLALNATIEAARAGEAGRGFAVVANEVKELAKQTAKATNDITNKIGAIQKDTQKAVEAIGGISEAVEKLNGISGVIAAAVEEQTATTNEVSRVVVESKQGVENIASNVKNVSNAAGEGKVSAGQTLTASKELSRLAERLNALVKAV